MNRSVLKTAVLLAASFGANPAPAESPGEIKGAIDGREIAVAGTCDAIPEDQVFSFSTDGGEADVDGAQAEGTVGGTAPKAASESNGSERRPSPLPAPARRTERRYLKELQRRNVLRIGVIYAVAGWIALEAIWAFLPELGVPGWVHKLLTALVVLGWPVVMISAWVAEVTPGEVRLDREVKKRQRVTRIRGRKLEFLVLGALAIGFLYLMAQRWTGRDATDEPVLPKADIPALANHFIERKIRELKLHFRPVLSPGASNRLRQYDWPGNVRELQNAVERALILNRGEPLRFPMLASLSATATSSAAKRPMDSARVPRLDEVVSDYMRRLLTTTGGRIAGPKGAAKLAGLSAEGFVILDEIHHAGHDKAWGDGIRVACGHAARRRSL